MSSQRISPNDNKLIEAEKEISKEFVTFRFKSAEDYNEFVCSKVSPVGIIQQTRVSARNTETLKKEHKRAMETRMHIDEIQEYAKEHLCLVTKRLAELKIISTGKDTKTNVQDHKEEISMWTETISHDIITQNETKKVIDKSTHFFNSSNSRMLSNIKAFDIKIYNMKQQIEESKCEIAKMKKLGKK